VVRASRPHEGVKSLADPEQAAHPPPTALGVPQDHQGRSRDVAEPAGKEVAVIEAVENVVGKTVGVEQGGDVVGVKPGAVGQVDRPAKVGDGQGKVAAEPPAEPSGGGPAPGHPSPSGTRARRLPLRESLQPRDDPSR